jgi:hypothetical protein
MTDITRLRICLCLVVMAVMPVAATGYELHYDADGPALNDVCALEVDGHAVFWTVGDSGKVFKIVDGQLTDSFTLGGGDYDLHGVSFFPAGQTGHIVGYKRYDPQDTNRFSGIVFRTLNSGTNWQSRPIDFPDRGIKIPCLKVQCVPPHYVWVTCGDGYWLWSNYWDNWQLQSGPGGWYDYSYLWGLWCLDSLHAWVATDESMLIAKTTNMGGTWTPYRPFPDDSLSYRGIGPFAPQSGLDFDRMSVAGSRGKIVHTTDGGSNWSEEPYNPCQWWRGTSQNYTGCGGRLCVGTSGIPGSTTRYDLNDVEQIEIGYNHWNVSVGTNAAIEVDSFNTSPGILGYCTLNWLDATPDTINRKRVFVRFQIANTTDHDSLVDLWLWRSIMEEDYGGDATAYFYHVIDSSRWDVPACTTITESVAWFPPTDQTFWYALTTTHGPNCSTSPNVDSVSATSAQHRPILDCPYTYTSLDAPDDHGDCLRYTWDTIHHPYDTFTMRYAIIRPSSDTTHPYYTGHKGGLIGAAYSGQQPYYETALMTGRQYRRGARTFYLDLLGGTASQDFAEDTATPIDNTAPPKVTGLSGRYVPQLDAAELWWDPVPDSGEPNLGGYWVCPEVVFDEYTINHQSPLFRNHYIEHVPSWSYDGYWVFAVSAGDRTGNCGAWSDPESIYIPPLASTSDLATAYNNGTHLARLPGTANEHVVYESNGEVHYANSTDGGSEWLNRTLLDTGISPAIATDESAHVWIVYLRDNTLRYKFSNPNTAWGGGVLYDPNDSSVVLGPLTIAARTSSALHYAYAAFPEYDLDARTSVIKVVKFDDDTSEVVTVDTVPNEAMSDSFVSLSLTPGDSIHCCWQRGSAVLYSEARVAPAQWGPIVWTSPSVISPLGVVAKHPFCEDWGDWVIVVWSDQGTGEIMRISRQVATPTPWSLPVNVSNTEEFSDFPQASSPCAVSWQDLKASGKWEVMARAGTELITLTSNANGNSRYAHISAELADSTDSAPAAVYAVWTDGTAEDDYYEVKSCVWGQGGQGGGMAARQVPIVVTELSSAAPNPFSRATGIRYQLAREGHAKLSVFDATGRVVRTLVDCRQKPGMFTVTWNGTDNRQRSVPRGVYFVKLDAPQYTGQRKVTLTR